MNYKQRIIDDQLDLKLESFGATLIVGPKGCGKTTSAKQKARVSSSSKTRNKALDRNRKHSQATQQNRETMLDAFT